MLKPFNPRLATGCRHILYLLAVCSPVWLASCQSSPFAQKRKDSQERWHGVRADFTTQLAQQAYDTGRFEEAIKKSAEAIVLNPKLTPAHVIYAQANLELGKLAAAERGLRQARDAGLATADLVYLEGIILEQRGELTQALGLYARARGMEPFRADILRAQAEVLVELNRPREALTALEEGREGVDDRDGAVAALTGQVLLQLDQESEAVRWFRKALVAAPDHPVVAEKLGTLLVQLGRFEEARSVLAPLIDSAKGEVGHATVRKALAKCHLALHDAQRSVDLLDDYAKAHPRDVTAQLLLAQAAVEVNDTLTALRALDGVLRVDREHPEAALLRAYLLMKRGDASRAAATIFDLLVAHPEDVEAHCLLGEVMRVRGQKEASRRQFEKALALNPQCRWAAQALALLPFDEEHRDRESETKLTSSAP